MKFKIKIRRRYLIHYLVLPLISALVGALMVLVFAPLMQNAEYNFWEKKFRKETQRVLVEKRIESVQEFNIAEKEANRCVDKAILDVRADIYGSGYGKAGFLDRICGKELDAIWNAGFKANAYYDDETRTELQNLNTKIQMLLFKFALSPYNTENYQVEFSKSSSRVLELMQTNLFNFD